MQRLRWVAVVVLGFTGLAASADGSADDLKALQGPWSAMIIEIAGKPASKEEMNLKLLLIVQGENYRVLANDQLVAGGKLLLDASKQPRTIDTTHTEGPFKGVVQKGIYELKGDTMVAAFAKPGEARPTEFKTKEGTEQSLVRYVRAKK